MAYEEAASLEAMADAVRRAYDSADLDAFGMLLDEHVRWGPPEDTPETCHSRDEVMAFLSCRRSDGVETHVVEVSPGTDSLVLGLEVTHPSGVGRRVYQVLRVRDGLIADIRPQASRAEAAAAAGLSAANGDDAGKIHVRGLTPILNVTSLADSFTWFEKLGWTKLWDWRDDGGEPSFGAVGAGEHQLFLALNEQGAHGMWLSMWVDDVDQVHAVCLRDGLEVLRPPADEPWGVREMQVRHPDGHVLRVSQPRHQH